MTAVDELPDLWNSCRPANQNYFIYFALVQPRVTQRLFNWFQGRMEQVRTNFLFANEYHNASIN